MMQLLIGCRIAGLQVMQHGIKTTFLLRPRGSVGNFVPLFTGRKVLVYRRYLPWRW